MKKTFLPILLCLALSACGPSPETLATPTTVVETKIAASWTATSTATNTPTHTPTLTPTATRTLPTPTATLELVSGNGTQKVALSVKNLGTETLALYRVDRYGNDQNQGTIAPMETMSIGTLNTIAYRLKNSARQEVARFVTTADEIQNYQIQPNGQLTLEVIPTRDSPCKLSAGANPSETTLGFPPSLLRTNPVGTVKAKVLFVDFSDFPAQETPAQTFASMSPAASDFFKAVSYGRLNLQLEPHLVWFRMSKPTTDYNLAGVASYATNLAYLKEAIALADATVDFSSVQVIYVVANPQETTFTVAQGINITNNTDAIKVDGNIITHLVRTGTRGSGFSTITHEISHNMGLPDLYATTLIGQGVSTTRFTGNFGWMACAGSSTCNGEYFFYERWNLGWLDDNQIVCQTSGTQSTRLAPIETKGDTKAVVVPISRTLAVVVESRRAIGYDNKLAKPGALVYTVDTLIKSGDGPIRIFPAIEGDPKFDKSPLAVGESVTVNNVTIRVTAADANGDTVEVTIGK